jgi:putative ABC transport system permease protein
LRPALRALIRSPGFTAAVILILGVAIALQTSMVAVVNAYLLRGLPYPAAERLHSVRYAEDQQPSPARMETLDWSSLADVIEHPIAWDLDVFYLTGGEYPERAPGAWVTPGFMQGLGIPVARGRSFNATDFAPGQQQVALISDALWRERFGGDSAIVGRTFNAYVSDRPADPEHFTIVGVLPPDFWHLNPYTQVLTPLRAATYPYLVRVQPDVPVTLAAARIERLIRGGGLTIPPNWRGVELRSTHAEYTRAARPMLLAVGGAVLLVFLIACANIGLLVVLRGMRRRKEIAVRVALGAGFARMARLLLTESLLLVAAATTVGLLIATLTLRLFGGAIEQQLRRRVPGGVSAIGIDWTVIAIVGASVLVVALILSLAPLVGAGPVFSTLRDRRASTNSGGRHTRSALIVVEVAGSLALLAGCGLMVRTVVRMLDVDPGMQVAGIVSTPLAIRQQSYPEPRARAELYERLHASLGEMAGASGVVLSGPGPLASYQPLGVQGAPPGAGTLTGRASLRSILGDYFGLLGIDIMRGRAIGPTDRATSEPVAVVSESVAGRLWPNADPVGRTIRILDVQYPAQDTVVTTRTVVGVARDVRESPTDVELAEVYVPLVQTAGRFAAVVMRNAGGPDALTAVRRRVSAVDPEIAVGAVQQLGETARQQLSRPRFLAALFSAFGIFAATLGAIGLYVVLAYAVKHREHEIAVRIAVGASGGDIARMVVRDGSWVVLAGLALGVVGAMAIGRLLRAQLFGVSPQDALTLAAATLLLVLVSLAAIWWPARRASRTDPVIALKAE